MFKVIFRINLIIVILSAVSFLINPLIGFLSLIPLGIIQVLIMVVFIILIQRLSTAVKVQVATYWIVTVSLLGFKFSGLNSDEKFQYIYVACTIAIFHLLITLQTKIENDI